MGPDLKRKSTVDERAISCAINISATVVTAAAPFGIPFSHARGRFCWSPASSPHVRFGASRPLERDHVGAYDDGALPRPLDGACVRSLRHDHA